LKIGPQQGFNAITMIVESPVEMTRHCSHTSATVIADWSMASWSFRLHLHHQLSRIQLQLNKYVQCRRHHHQLH